jgi:hypothetical protein
MTSSGTPMPRWKNSTASRRRPEATSSASSAVKSVSPAGAGVDSIGGSNRASLGMASLRAAACRASSPPEEKAYTNADPPASAMSAAKSSTSRSIA